MIVFLWTLTPPTGETRMLCVHFLCGLQGSGELAVDMKHFQEALKSVRPSCLRSSLGRADLSPVSWDQIGGLDDIKLKLRQVNQD